MQSTLNAHCAELDIAISAGYVAPYILYADHGATELRVLVKPDADLDDTFTAWDRDMQEFIAVNGWLFSFEAF